MSVRTVGVLLLGFLAACGGSVANGGTDGGPAGGSSSGGVGTGGIGTGGGGTGGIGTGGIGTGGIGTGGGGTGGIGTGGIGTGGIGTGGIGTGGIGGTSGDYCPLFCKVTSSCPNDTPLPKCLSTCAKDFPTVAAICGPQLKALYDCFASQAQISCSNQGDSKVIGCESQMLGYAQCTSCTPLAGDDPCEACDKVSCCSELSALYNSPSFLPFYQCINSCNPDPQCQQPCLTQFPEIQKLFSDFASCQSQKCAC
jgi:hypothetical protein